MQTQSTNYINICYYYKENFSVGSPLQELTMHLIYYIKQKKKIIINSISKYIIFNMVWNQ